MKTTITMLLIALTPAHAVNGTPTKSKTRKKAADRQTTITSCFAIAHAEKAAADARAAGKLPLEEQIATLAQKTETITLGHHAYRLAQLNQKEDTCTEENMEQMDLRIIFMKDIEKTLKRFGLDLKKEQTENDIYRVEGALLDLVTRYLAEGVFDVIEHHLTSYTIRRQSNPRIIIEAAVGKFFIPFVLKLLFTGIKSREFDACIALLTKNDYLNSVGFATAFMGKRKDRLALFS